MCRVFTCINWTKDGTHKENMYRFGTYFLYTYPKCVFFAKIVYKLDTSFHMGSVANHFATIHPLSKIALCNEQNLPKSVHRDEQMPGIIAIA